MSSFDLGNPPPFQPRILTRANYVLSECCVACGRTDRPGLDTKCPDKFLLSEAPLGFQLRDRPRANNFTWKCCINSKSKASEASNQSVYGYPMPRANEIWKGLTDGSREGFSLQIARVQTSGKKPMNRSERWRSPSSGKVAT